MKIFIDSADIEEIEKAKAYGLLDGVTTNPSLIKKAVDKLKKKGENIDMEAYITKILTVAKGLPVSLEVIGTSYDDMVKEGKRIFEKFNHVANNVYVKIPIDPALAIDSGSHFAGLNAIKELSSQGIPINCTLIFTPEQALLAAKAGAAFVSPFAGRIDDYIKKKNNISSEKTDYFPADGLEDDIEDNGIVSGIDLIEQCVIILRKYGLKTKVLAASIRNPRQVRESALVGADIATLPFGVIEKLLIHEKTIEGMNKFAEDTVDEYAGLLKG
ncbi:MAG: transaldolase [Nanoarchaeota archaeon]|nr:transaldolase [Nanoarchaeota archaeon]